MRQFGLEITPNPDRAAVSSDRALTRQPAARSFFPSTVRPGGEWTQDVLSLGMTVGNAAIARRLGPAARRKRPWDPPLPRVAEVLNAPGSVPFPPFGVLTTWGGLAVAAQFSVKEMARAMSAVGSDEGVRAGAAQWTEEMVGWITYARSIGEETRLGRWEVAQIAELLVVRATIAERATYIQAAAGAHSRRQVQAAAMAAAVEAEKLQVGLDQRMWAPLRAADGGRHTRAVGLAGIVSQIGKGLHDIARDAATNVGDGSGVNIGPISRYTGCLKGLSKALSTINFGLSARGEAGSTQLAEGMRQVSLMAETLRKLTTIAGEALPATMHLVSITKKIVAGIQQLIDQLHEDNRGWIELTGEPFGYSVERGNTERRL